MKSLFLVRIRRSGLCKAVILLMGALSGQCAHAVNWLPFGPDGGDARSLAGDPHDSTHLYLGTENGWIYESRDAGSSWKRLALVGKRDDLVLNHIVVDPTDPKHLAVATWALGKPDGGLYVSHDGGAHWTSASDLRGQSVLSLAVAASDPKIYVVGTLEGVYRSADAGEHWALVSPAGSKELHEVESVAIDPTDPQVVYAGTWHLPWKTSDGGLNWSNIKEGIIDDSDVFSILVDPKQPSTVYASACSGIYKSDNGGMQFKKVQGIPSTARRTRVLKQDPNDGNTVFAGTTEGLFRTQNAGVDWSRMTDPNVIVNDVFVDPSDSKHVVLATDRGGVLASHDGGVSFESANKGFSAQQVTSYAADAQRPGTMYVGVLNDKEFGGVFESETGGLSWFQRNGGLEGRDVFSLVQAPDGVMVAGTGHGIFRLEGDAWTRTEVLGVSANTAKVPVYAAAGAPVRATARAPIHAADRAPVHGGARQPTERRSSVKPPAKPAAKVAGKSKSASAVRAHAKQGSAAQAKAQMTAAKPKPVSGVQAPLFDGATFSFARSGDRIYAATTSGLLMSDSAGKTWTPVAGVEANDWRLVSAAKGVLAAANLRSVIRSVDGGQSWSAVPLPAGLTQVNALGTDDAGETWVGGIEGIFFEGSGQTEWQVLKSFYIRDVNSIYFDAQNERMLVTSNAPSKLVLSVHVPDHVARFWDSGWNLRFARPVGDYLVGATMFDGVVVQPRMVDSPSASQPTH